MSSLRIGTLAFTLERLYCDVPPYGHGQLRVELILRAADPDAAHAAGLTSAYNRGPSGGVVSFHLDALGVYGPGGVPTGRVEVEHGRVQGLAPGIQFRTAGADYPLSFSGAMALAEGRATVHGRFARAYSLKGTSFDVDLDVPLDTPAIRWTRYVFSSLAEIADAPRGVVRQVRLTRPAFTRLPEEITHLDALTSLTIGYPSAHHVPPPRLDVPPEIGRLRALERLAISGAALGALPPEIGQLERLEYLTLTRGGLIQVPDSVWRLPRLVYVSLADNQLMAIPAALGLPALKRLDLSRNALPTVPSTLADLPALNRLDLTGNPLEMLPEALRSIPNLELAIEDRQRLLPVPYPGAEAGYPEAAYRIGGWPDREAQLEALLEQAGPAVDPRVRPFLVATARPSVGFRRTAALGDRLGATRFGGLPDLPAAWTYPRLPASEAGQPGRVYEFIAQIDCEALAGWQTYLPRQGVLYVFLSTIHDLYGGPTAHPPVLVQHYEGPREALASGSRFQFTRDDYVEMIDPHYDPMPVVALPAVSVPPSYPLASNRYLFRKALAAVAGQDETFMEAYQGLDEGMDDRALDHELGGYGFSQHHLPETEMALAVGGEPEDWFTLLTVHSRGGMQWGDAGELYVLIHKADLARGDFSRVHATMYSS